MKNAMNGSSKQWQLLSAYLDGELSDRKKKQVQSLLSSDPLAAETLENLRKTKSLLRMLPTREVPHQYTLTRQEALVSSPGWLVNGLRVLSGVSAAALVAFLTLDLLIPMRAIPQSAMLESMAAEEAPALESMPAPEQDTLIQPFTYESAPQGFGLGGGGESPDEMFSQEQDLVLPDISIIEEETEIEDFAPDASLAEDSSTDSELSEFKGVPNAGPILGVAPQDQQGTVVERGAPHPFPRETRLASPAGLSYLTVEITLLTLSLFSALAAFIIRRKQNTLR